MSQVDLPHIAVALSWRNRISLGQARPAAPPAAANDDAIAGDPRARADRLAGALSRAASLAAAFVLLVLLPLAIAAYFGRAS